MKSTVTAIISVLSAVVLFEVGSSLLGVLQPIRGLFEGFPQYSIGSLGTAYYLGFIPGCLVIPRLINAFGHIRAFAASAAIAGVAALLNVFVIDLVGWFVLRVLFGFCFAGLYTVVESWLNELATARTRGRILAAYMSAVWLAVLLGKLLFTASDPLAVLPFAIVSMAISLSLVPVVLTTGIAPAPQEPVRFHPGEVYKAAPVGIVTCFLIGLTNGAFWILGPVYAQAYMASTESIGIFMAAIVLGGALAQWPVGRVSDLNDRRWVILANALVSAGFGLALAIFAEGHELLLYALAFCFGAAALPIYSLCIAHVNDRVSAGVFVQVSGQLLLTFGVAAMFGPLIASAGIGVFGAKALFAYTAVIHVVIAGYALWRATRVEPPPEAERVAYTVVPRSTPTVFEMQPTEAMKATDRKIDSDGS